MDNAYYMEHLRKSRLNFQEKIHPIFFGSQRKKVVILKKKSEEDRQRSNMIKVLSFKGNFL